MGEKPETAEKYKNLESPPGLEQYSAEVLEAVLRILRAQKEPKRNQKSNCD
jgi:hypothetical protein